MQIVGIDEYEFGVEDTSACERFVRDFGLQLVAPAEAMVGAIRVRALNGARVTLYLLRDPRLPPAIEAGSALRRVTWALESAEALEQLAERLADAPGFMRTEGTLTCRDPNGMTLRFRVNHLHPIDLPPQQITENEAMERIASLTSVHERATPLGIEYLSLFVEDLESVERFYRETLGFQVTDQYAGQAVFLRAAASSRHHDLLLLCVPGKASGLNHVAFRLRDMQDVFDGGMAMRRADWQLPAKPAFHGVCSACYWYVPSPAGGAFTFYSAKEPLGQAWVPRALQPSEQSLAEWMPGSEH